MKDPSESYTKVQYELRAAKQVERRMLIDAFQKLVRVGFEIHDYQYTGMGSIYFVDFILFHRILGISKMLSVEYSTKIPQRIIFNRPFGFIAIEMKPIGDIIPSLSRDIKHILWLDYDSILYKGHLEDIYLAASRLPRESILLVTLDVEPPVAESDDPHDWRDYFEQHAGDYLPVNPKLESFSKSNLPKLNAEVIFKVINAGLAARDVEFLPLFNFVYRDGHQMLSVGGMIGSDSERSRILSSELSKTTYIRMGVDLEPYEIRVPKVTRKERLHLDSAMPCGDTWEPKEFELSKEDVLAYRDIYRFFPAYAELLL